MLSDLFILLYSTLTSLYNVIERISPQFLLIFGKVFTSMATVYVVVGAYLATLYEILNTLGAVTMVQSSDFTITGASTNFNSYITIIGWVIDYEVLFGSLLILLTIWCSRSMVSLFAWVWEKVPFN